MGFAEIPLKYKDTDRMKIKGWKTTAYKQQA